MYFLYLRILFFKPETLFCTMYYVNDNILSLQNFVPKPFFQRALEVKSNISYVY